MDIVKSNSMKINNLMIILKSTYCQMLNAVSVGIAVQHRPSGVLFEGLTVDST